MPETNRLVTELSGIHPTADFPTEAARDAQKYTQDDVGKVVKVDSPSKYWLIVSVSLKHIGNFREITSGSSTSVDASDVANDSSVTGATVKDALQGLSTRISAEGVASGIGNDSAVSGATVKDALDTLSSMVGPGGAVSSVFGRVGAITAQSGDYTAAQVGAVPLSRSLVAGMGLLGGGDLSLDRSVAVDFGSSAHQVCEGSDSRLSDARTPLSHALSHSPGGADALATAVPVALGTSNQLGSANSYSRSDHVHDASALLPRDGSRAMSAALDAGGNNLTNIGAVFAAPTSFAWSAGAAAIDVSAKNDFVASNLLTANSTLTLSGGSDGCQGTVYVKQDATGGRTLAFSVAGRTILREAGALDSNPQPTASTVTGYSYDFKTIGGTAYVIVERFFLT